MGKKSAEKQIIVGECVSCRQPIFLGIDALKEGISLENHLTCGYGHANSVDVILRALENDGILDEVDRIRDLVIREFELRLKGKASKSDAESLAFLYHRRGLAAANGNDFEKARDDIYHALELTPQNEEMKKDYNAIVDFAFGTKQIQEKLEEKDFESAVNLLLGYCARHPEDDDARKTLASLLNQMAVQAANVAQKIFSRESSSLDWDERDLLRRLEKIVLIGKMSTASEGYELIKASVILITLAKSVDPADQTIKENSEVISRIVEALGMSYEEYADTEKRFEWETVFSAKRKTKKTGSALFRRWLWFFTGLLLVVNAVAIFVVGLENAIRLIYHNGKAIAAAFTCIPVTLGLEFVTQIILLSVRYLWGQVTSFLSEFFNPLGRKKETEEKKPSYAERYSEEKRGWHGFYPPFIVVVLVSAMLGLLSVFLVLLGVKITAFFK